MELQWSPASAILDRPISLLALLICLGSINLLVNLAITPITDKSALTLQNRLLEYTLRLHLL